MSRLKPCPYCLEAAEMHVDRNDGLYIGAYVKCTKCNMTGPKTTFHGLTWMSKEDAALIWNALPRKADIECEGREAWDSGSEILRAYENALAGSEYLQWPSVRSLIEGFKQKRDAFYKRIDS